MSDTDHLSRLGRGITLLGIATVICIVSVVVLSFIWGLIQKHGSIVVLGPMMLIILAYLFGVIDDRVGILNPES